MKKHGSTEEIQLISRASQCPPWQLLSAYTTYSFSVALQPLQLFATEATKEHGRKSNNLSVLPSALPGK